MKKLILGSASPRRRELLGELGFSFEVRTKDTDESCPGVPAHEQALFIAKKKADALKPTLNSNEVLICADTTVLLGDQVMNKPQSRDEAFKMLFDLSGKVHEVCTGIVIFADQTEQAFSVTTEVEFQEMSANEINYYIDTMKPFDKAGSYGIQEWIGHAFVKRINGSYNNVVGLPTSEVYAILKQIEL